jgi:hypothetical protein
MSDGTFSLESSLDSQQGNSIEIKAPNGTTSFLDKIEFIEGNNVTITVNAVAKSIEIASSGSGGSDILGSLELTNQPFVTQAAGFGSSVSFVRLASGSASDGDAIDTGLTLARGSIRGLFNAESEQSYDNSSHNSPAGTEWNAEGWGNLLGVQTRSYSNLRSVLNNQIGNNIVGAELVMHDTINNKYYKFLFSDWGENNGGSFAYARTQITTIPNYFQKENYGSQTDIFVANDPVGDGIAITRGSNQGIYNPYQDEGWSENFSPSGTEWNVGGWNDLSDIESRTYTNFNAALGGNNIGNNVVGRELIMHIPSVDQYYAIKFTQWTQNNAGGGFAYNRFLINLDELQEGVKFPDGTLLKSASGVGRIKSTASGDRRIDEVYGNKIVYLSPLVTENITATLAESNSNVSMVVIDIASSNIDEILGNTTAAGIWDTNTIEFSIDNSTWYRWNGTSVSGDLRYYSLVSASLTYNQGDNVYFRYNTGGQPVVWWNKVDLPGSYDNFRGAVIDYHAFTGEGTFIGTIHIVDDNGEEYITHTEVSSGSNDSENDDLWFVQNEGTISYRRIDGEGQTLKIQWAAKVFYGDEIYD